VIRTPLEARIARLIERGGPLTIAAFMALALGDPEDGYYIRRNAIGADGDFITAPEISQLFGEMIGVHLALLIDRMPPHGPFALVELGPGRGTLMADMLRTLAKLRPGAMGRVSVELVETSPRLRALQTEAVKPWASPRFHEAIATLPDDRPLLVVANEFFDALPIRQFVKAGRVWRERMIGLDHGRPAFTLGVSTLTKAALPSSAATVPDGSIFEVAPAREAVVADLAARFASQSGAGLIIDYGHGQSGFGDTLQAMRGHAPSPVLEQVGMADITSHVDFQPLMAAAGRNGCQTGFVTQGEFLLRLGLLERAGRLGAGKSAAEQEVIRQAVERLAGPGTDDDQRRHQMGGLFKVMAMAGGMLALPGLPAPFDNAIETP
jgi:NADH dehydrogenase [ubiquinone] 1 alpha subcomplex assembly factor 7